MARFLALDWDHQQLHVVAATTTGTTVRVQRAAIWKETQNPNPAEAESLGHLLRDRLKEAGIAPAPVLVCVGRDRVILKELRFPIVVEADEPALVRFQAVKEMANPADEVVIDYIPRGGDGRTGERRAQVVILRKELLNTYKSLCAAAGLKLVAITPRPFATAACLTHVAGTTVLTPAPEPRNAPVAVLTVGATWAEFCIIRDGEPQLARSLAVPGTNDAALIGEIRRNLAVYAGQAAQHPVRALYVAGNGEHGGLRERLQDLLAIPVHTLDPFGGLEDPNIPVGNRGSFIGAIGLIHARADAAQLPINFVKPREPKSTHGPTRVRLVLGGLIAAGLAGITIFLCGFYLASLRRELRHLDAESDGLKLSVAQADEDNKRLKAIGDWANNEVVWIDELYDLADRFRDIEKVSGMEDISGQMRLTQFIGDRRAKLAKTKHVGTITLKGVVTEDPKPVDLLMAQLVKEGTYTVEPKHLGRNISGLERGRFVQQFSTVAHIEKRAPDKYVRLLPPPPPPDQRRPRAKPEPGGGRKPGPNIMDFDPDIFDGLGEVRP